MNSERKARTPLLIFLIAAVFMGIGSKGYAANILEWENASLSSAAVGAGATTAMLPCSGKCLVDAISLSSTAATNAYVELRDTGTANTSNLAGFASFLTIFASTTSIIGPSGYLAPPRWTFNPPLRVLNGLSTNSSACAAGGLCYSVQFRRVDE